jgi:hypothetical protein
MSGINLNLTELWRTLRDDVFATWFGWSLIAAIVIFPVTSTMGSCYDAGVKEDIELAKLNAAHGDPKGPRLSREATQFETIKWMVVRGIHPFVARCAVVNSPINRCAAMMGDLENKDLVVIQEVLQNPNLGELNVQLGEASLGLPTGAEPRAAYYTAGHDFGSGTTTE